MTKDTIMGLVEGIGGLLKEIEKENVPILAPLLRIEIPPEILGATTKATMPLMLAITSKLREMGIMDRIISIYRNLVE